MRSQSPLKRRAEGQPEDESGRRQAEATQVPSGTGRWWSQLRTEDAQAKTLANFDGTPLRILGPDDLSRGAVIEITGATDAAAGPEELEANEPRVFIVTKKGEHYLTLIAPGSDEAQICDHLRSIVGEVDDAVTRSKLAVDVAVDSIVSLEQTLGQMNLAKAVASLPGAPAAATSSTDPHGSRQGEVQGETVETPSEAPVPMSFMKMDVDDDEIEPPDLVTAYDKPEEPLMHDLDSATLLSKQVWAAAEKSLDTMTPAELEEIKHKTCAEEWQKMVEQHRTTQSVGLTGDRQVEGMSHDPQHRRQWSVVAEHYEGAWKADQAICPLAGIYLRGNRSDNEKANCVGLPAHIDRATIRYNMTFPGNGFSLSRQA